MLRESFPKGLSEKSGRRWFSDEDCDLFVWQDEERTISGFQLCYDKNKNERALTWTKDKGYLHERVDDGEANPSKNATPILIPDGTCQILKIIELFLEKSIRIDPQTRLFIADKLREYT